ncbi:hypothetical protein CDAR_17441 [Caerostris darwini]|uniref:Uncharacterized protein n=1 Tax=Caerostris darwini TaxID=1538125 RepID=A0AAV4VEM7_9ARAC|nr:hypothetical protein CDAR_17441 [Caerostris darwini]
MENSSENTTRNPYLVHKTIPTNQFSALHLQVAQPSDYPALSSRRPLMPKYILMRPQQKARTQSTNNGARHHATLLDICLAVARCTTMDGKRPAKFSSQLLLRKKPHWKHYTQSLSAPQNDPNKLIFRIASASSSSERLPIAKLLGESPIAR